MPEKESGYVEGDERVPVDAEVEYFGSRKHGRYLVDGHVDPASHPDPPQHMSLEEAYPDGVAYTLWPVGVPLKFGNRNQSVVFARRTSFRVVSDD